MAGITSRRLKIEYELLSKETDMVESVTLTEDDFGKWQVTNQIMNWRRRNNMFLTVIN